MKYLFLIVLSIIPSLALAQETAKQKVELPPAVLSAADTRIKITIEWNGETYRILVPAPGPKGSIDALKEALKNAGVDSADRKTADKAVSGGGRHAVLSALNGNYVMIPLK
jgi:hypothetical protein